MLRRERKLQIYFDKYYKGHDYAQFKIGDIEWQQID